MTVNFLLQNINHLYYKCLMSNKDLTKEELYLGVKQIIESKSNHIHLCQQKLYTLYSVAFNYILFESERNPGHYIIRIEDNYLLEKLAKNSKDMSSRKFLQKLNLPRRLKYGQSMFHLDFFSFTTWANTNELPKAKVKGALVVKNANKAIMHDMPEDEEVQAILNSMPKDYYLKSLQEFVPNIISIAYEEEFEDMEKVRFPFIKDESNLKPLKGVQISGDVNFDDLED